MAGLLLWFTLAVGVSFLCSLLEAVILSVTHPYVGTLEKAGKRSGAILRDLKARLDRPLAAILTLNTVANTLGAAGVGAQAQKVFGHTSVAIVSGILTLCILVFSEIIPKTLGATYWRIFAPFAAYAIRLLIILTWPAVWASERFSGMLSQEAIPHRVTREEMIEVAELGETEGALLGRETRIIKNLVRLDNIYVEDVMTPRAVMLAMQREWTVEEALDRDGPIPFSRIPVYGKDLDDVAGFVHRYRLLEAYAQDLEGSRLEELSTPIHSILPKMTVASALEEFLLRREHIFLVIDEYGGTAGIVTLEDVVETLLGVEIVDEYDSVEDMRKLARAQWEQRIREHQLEVPNRDREEAEGRIPAPLEPSREE